MGLFNNEAIAKTSPFRAGPLKGVADVEEIVFNWVSWYSRGCLHRFFGNIPPEEHERNYYAQNIGASTGDAANKMAA
jgi:putative transposase